MAPFGLEHKDQNLWHFLMSLCPAYVFPMFTPWHVTPHMGHVCSERGNCLGRHRIKSLQRGGTIVTLKTWIRLCHSFQNLPVAKHHTQKIQTPPSSPIQCSFTCFSRLIFFTIPYACRVYIALHLLFHLPWTLVTCSSFRFLSCDFP